jgi:hypothetical protein
VVFADVDESQIGTGWVADSPFVMTTESARKARLCSQIWMSERAHRSLPSTATTEAARKLRRVLEMLAGPVERPDSSQPTQMNGEFMPTDSSGRRSPSLHDNKNG